MANNGKQTDEPLKVRERVPKPTPDQVGNWSEETQQALSELSDRERNFVLFLGSGCNAAAAYRRAYQLEYDDRDKDWSRVNGCLLKQRPKIAQALGLILKDQDFHARMDRTWLLQQLEVALEKASSYDSVEAQEVVVKIVEAIAKLKGEYLPESQVHRHSHEITPAMQRFIKTVEDARRRAAGEPVVVVQNEGEREPIEN